MNKGEFIAALAEKAGASKVEAGKCFDNFVAVIFEGLKADGKVDLAGFGKFEVKDVPARDGINPATGAKIKIAASKKLAFKAAKAAKEAI